MTLSTSTTDDGTVKSAQNAPQWDEQASAGKLSTDITLTALAQLGVHRLACNRAFVSIIDGGNHHIIAEATASISLRDKDKHLPNDGIYLGARSLDLLWGICPHAISLFTGTCDTTNSDNITANRTRYIIRDLAREEIFKDCPYVRAWPFIRFYAEVPLYSPSGFVLGSYCVIDDKPRAEFDDDDVNTLREVADAVAQHLEHVRIVHCHRRSERLIKGLTNFVKDHADFDPREVSNDHRLEAMAAVASNVNTSTQDSSPGPMEATLDQQFGFVTSSSTCLSEDPSPLFFAGPSSGPTELSSLNSNVSERRSSRGEERSIDEVLKAGSQPLEETNNASQLSLAESTSLGKRIERIFHRASVLLRKSMDLDGVVFLDAARSNPSL